MITLPSFTGAHVLVAGDVMLDRYWHGETSRISPEAPVPVVAIGRQEERPGGAANVALNVCALGVNTHLLGVTGDDAAANSLRALLEAQGIHCHLQSLPHHPTITKLRVLSRHQQLLRLDFEQPLPIVPELGHELAALVWQCQVVVFSDYGKGTLRDLPSLVQTCRAAGKPVLIDPKGRDFSPYRGASAITPNRQEFEAVVGECSEEAQLVERGLHLCADLQLEALLITRSEEGMSLIRPGHSPLHLPAHAREVFDVTGAGDTVISVLAATLAAGGDWVDGASLANLAAGLVVAKLGAATVNSAELEYALYGQRQQGIVSEQVLLNSVAAAQARGETVVMTNGCFDILHAGHVQYLQQARQLGDRLIVAVNDDASVARLKGQQRPLNPLARRMAVLNALESVDWVVPFSEDTPERLICQVLPNILVKGGDYRVADIAGHDCVLDHGGRVLILDFVDNCSTTALIHAIHRVASAVR